MANLSDKMTPTGVALTTQVTFETLNSNGDVGTGAGQLAVGNHTQAISTITGLQTELDDINTDLTTAYNYSQVGHLPLAGGTTTGDIIIDNETGARIALSSLTGNLEDAAVLDLLENAVGVTTFGTSSSNGFRVRYNGDINTFEIISGQITTVRKRFSIDRNTGDTSFYADDGTTANFYWDASASSLGIGTTTPTTALDVSGVITATGGNSTNWNTAYGWGNHASAGYLTSIPTPVNGDWWNNGFVKVGSDGVMEVGKYLDFHTADSGGNADYDLRVTATPGALSVGGTIAATGGNSTNWNTAYGWGDHSTAGYAAASHNHNGTYTPYNDIRSLGVRAFTNGTDPNITTAQVISEIESDGGFDSYTSAFKTSWSYAGNYNLTDAGGFTETAGTAWLTWTDNSDDTTRGNITALAIAPNTGGSAGGVFIYNDQGSSYSPGWREVWTSLTDGAGSGLDADLLDGQQGSYYLNTSTSHSGDITGTYNNLQIAANVVNANELNVSGNGTSGQFLRSDGDGSFNWYTLPSYLTGNQTITLSGDLSGSGTTSINAQIAANVVGANELNVSGNGTSGQVLSSDGDGSMTWTTPSSGGVTTGKAIAMAIVFG